MYTLEQLQVGLEKAKAMNNPALVAEVEAHIAELEAADEEPAPPIPVGKPKLEKPEFTIAQLEKGLEKAKAMKNPALIKEVEGHLQHAYDYHDEHTGFLNAAANAWEDLPINARRGVGTLLETVGAKKAAKEQYAKADESRAKKKVVFEPTTPEDEARAEADNGVIGKAATHLTRKLTEPMGSVVSYAPAMAATPLLMAGSVPAGIAGAGALGIQALTHAGELKEQGAPAGKALAYGAGQSLVDIALAPAFGAATKLAGQVLSKTAGSAEKAAVTQAAKEAYLAKVAEAEKNGATVLSAAERKAAFDAAKAEAERVAGSIPTQRTKKQLAVDAAKNYAGQVGTLSAMSAANQELGKLATETPEHPYKAPTMAELGDTVTDSAYLAAPFAGLHTALHNPQEARANAANAAAEGFSPENVPEYKAVNEEVKAQEAARHAEENPPPVKRTKEEQNADTQAAKTAWQQAVEQKAKDDFHEQYAGHDFDTVLNADQQKWWLNGYRDAAKTPTTPEALQAVAPTANRNFTAVKSYMEDVNNPKVPEPLEQAARKVAAVYAVHGIDAADNLIETQREFHPDVLSEQVGRVLSEPKPFHPNAAALAGFLHEGGGYEMVTVPDPHKPNSTIQYSTPSRNPDWYKDKAFKPIDAEGNVLLSTPSVQAVQAAAQAYATHQKLTIGQENIMRGLHHIAEADEIEGRGIDINQPNEAIQAELAAARARAQEVQAPEEVREFDQPRETIRNSDEPPFSKNAVPVENAHTEESLVNKLRTDLAPHYGEDFLATLANTGKFKVTPREVIVDTYGEDAAQAKGFYDPTRDITHLIPENIEQGENLHGLVLHEVAAHALKMGEGDKGWQSILDHAVRLTDQDTPLGRKVRTNIEAAQTPKHQVREERLAYLLEHHPELSISQRAVAWLRAALRKIGNTLPGADKFKWNKWANDLTEKDLVHIARKVLKNAPDDLRFNWQEREGIRKSDSYIRGNTKKSIEFRRSESKGLDMTDAGRMARAEAMGFDTSKVWYHGTHNTFKEFSTDYGADYGSRSGAAGTISFTADKNFAENHGGEVHGVYLKVKNPFDYTNEQHQMWAYHELLRLQKQWFKDQGIDNPGMAERNAMEQLDKLKRGDYNIIEKTIPPAWYKDNGFDAQLMKEHGALNINVFDPSLIRRTDAAFDPEHETSANIYYSKRLSPEQERLAALGTTVNSRVKEPKSIREGVKDTFRAGMQKHMDSTWNLVRVLAEGGLGKINAEGKYRGDVVAHGFSQVSNLLGEAMREGGVAFGSGGDMVLRKLPYTLHNGKKTTASFDSIQKTLDSAKNLPDAFNTYMDVAYVLDAVDQAKRDPSKLPAMFKDPSVLDAAKRDAVAIRERHPEIKDALNMWQKINRALIDIELEGGLINQETAQIFRDSSNYSPRYEVRAELGDALGADTGKSVKIGNTQTKIFKERVSSDHAADVFDNQVRHFTSAILGVYANQTKRVIASNLAEIGQAEFVGRTHNPENKGNLAVMIDGKRQFYRLQDPALFGALTTVRPEMGVFMKTGHLATKALRYGTLNNFGFLATELIRNTMAATMFTNVGFVGPWNAIGELLKIGSHGGNDVINKLHAHGVVGRVEGSFTPQDRSRLLKHFGEATKTAKAPVRLMNKVDNMLHSMHTAVDASTRAAVYRAAFKKAKRKGMNDTKAEAYAIMEARESINFSISGDSDFAYGARVLVPFFSASTNGLMKAWTAATGRDLPPKERAAAKASFRIKAAGLTTISFMAAQYLSADPEYQQMSDQDKYYYMIHPTGDADHPWAKWNVPHELVPLWALGNMLSQFSNGTVDGKEFWKTWSSVAKNITPPVLPQVVKPLLENMTNYDFHFDRPIETAADARKEVLFRGEAAASEIAKKISKGMPEELRISPAKIEHFMNGTFGAMGAVAEMMADYMLQDEDSPVKPTKEFNTPIGKILGIRSKLVDLEQTQERNDFYTHLAETEHAKDRDSELKKLHRGAERGEFRADPLNAVRISAANYMSAQQKRMAKLEAQIKALPYDKTKDADQKAIVKRQLRQQINAIAANAEKQYAARMSQIED